MTNDQNNGWHNLVTQAGGVQEKLLRLPLPPGEKIRERPLASPLDKFFSACEEQWRVYDQAFLVGNPITAEQERESARAVRDVDIIRIVKAMIHAETAKRGGPELYVLGRLIGTGIRLLTPEFRMDDYVQLQDVLVSISNEMPTLVPGVVIHPGEKLAAMACIGRGDEETIKIFASHVRDTYMPEKWGLSYGQRPGSEGTGAWVAVNATGEGLQKFLEIKGPPPTSLVRWTQRMENLWHRLIDNANKTQSKYEIQGGTK